MAVYDIFPQLSEYYFFLRQEKATPNLYADDVALLLSEMEATHTDIHQTLDILHRAHRLVKIFTAGLSDDPSFKELFSQHNLKSWKNFNVLNADIDKQKKLADRLYLGQNGEPPITLINAGNQSREITAHLIKRNMDDAIPVFINFADPDFNDLLINAATPEGVLALASMYNQITADITTVSSIRDTTSSTIKKTNKDNFTLYAKETIQYSKRIQSGQIRWILTVLPSASDAQRDGIPHDQYINHYLEMCDQPLDYDDTPQKELIKELDAASTLRFTNNDGTDVSMSLIDHDGTKFTFCNSTNKRNVPGSEAFSAPRRDSVNGIIVAKGKHPLRGDGAKTIEDLTMWFEQGRIVKFTCKTHEQEIMFQSYLDRDPNNYYIGEIGIGTNPYLKAHVANTLLVEKIGGQFHVALGGCYTMTDYIGDPVYVNNGNHTANGDHWDIATMLYGRGGRIYLDGRAIMDDGKFIDDKYAVLNDGWAAVPEDKRPAHRKNLSLIKTKFERPLE